MGRQKKKTLERVSSTGTWFGKVSVLFYLDPLVLVKVDIFSKSGFLELAKIFFFELTKEVLIGALFQHCPGGATAQAHLLAMSLPT